MRQFVFLALVLLASSATATGDFETELKDGFRRFHADGGNKRGDLVDYLPEEAKFIPGYIKEYLFGSMRPRPKAVPKDMTLTSTIKVMPNPRIFYQTQSEVLCTACTAAMETLITQLDIFPPLIIKQALITGCTFLNIVSANVCDGIVNNYWVRVSTIKFNSQHLGNY